MTQRSPKFYPAITRGNAQTFVNAADDWSRGNLMQLNADKCKVLRIDFTLVKHYFEPLSVNRLDISVVENAIMLMQQWNDHINATMKKVNKRMRFLALLRRASVLLSNILKFNCTMIRSVLKYCSTVSEPRLI